MTSRVLDVTHDEDSYRRLSDDDVAALNTFENAIHSEEHPDDPALPLDLTARQARNHPEFSAFREVWVRDPDGSIVAMAYGHWRRDVDDNRHLLNCNIQVRRDRRRQGYARKLLRHIADVSEAEDRPVLMFGTNERVPSGEAFARRLDARPAFKAHTNRLVLAGVDRVLIDRWIEEGPTRAPGYSLLPIDGAMPDDLVDAFVDLGDVMNTAPRDDLDMEDSHMTPEHLRQWEASMREQGIEKWTLIARQDATGELAGYTEVTWNPARPWVVSQGDTGVRPEHRGHALGKWLKATMLHRILAERPEATDVRTGNADSNDAMLGINHALGFGPYLAVTWWNADVENVRSYLDGSST